jgi:hypothetical protein
MFSISDTWDAAKSKHKKYVLAQIKIHLDYPQGDPRHIACGELRNFVRRHDENIATGNVEAIEKIISNYEEILKNDGSGPCIDLFLREARRIFNYSYFIGKKVNVWCAYNLCKTSKFRMCPYCNQNFAFTIMSENGDFRPTLDHYFPKSVYPFLAISLYNLVPSCYTCNSNLKESKNFYKIPHLHPFNMKNELIFAISSKNSDDILKIVSNQIEFNKFATVGIRDTTDVAACNSINTFLLNHRFALHEEDFLRFAYWRRQLTSGRVLELKKIFGNEIEVSTILGFDILSFKNNVHGKILGDLYEQFKPVD